jgi:cell division transport system permease protein
VDERPQKRAYDPGEGADAEEIAAATEAALGVLNSTDGVLEATAMPPQETAKLLEPWLGAGNVGEYLNVPALIEVKVNDALRRDLSLLRTRLAAAAPGAVLDDHGGWHNRLSAAAGSGQLLAFSVFMLIMGAACAISIFAARAGLAANSEIVSILHLVGATDDFIANQVQRRFFVIGLRGSIAGLLLAILALGLVSLALRAGDSEFLPSFGVGPGLIAILLAVPIALCLVTAMTARLTVLKALGKEL